MSMFASRLLLVLLTLATLVKVFDDDSNEHVEHEEADEQQERDEVSQSPLVVVSFRLRHKRPQYTRSVGPHYNIQRLNS